MTAKKPVQVKLIDQITPRQAYAVVCELWHSDKSARPKIESLIREMLLNVDYKKVRDDVTASFYGMSADEVYDHSGGRSDGYHDPGEVAIQMLEDACKEHEEQMARYHKLGMDEAEKEYCKGVLLALHEFESSADKDFFALAPEMALEAFDYIFSDWKKRCRKKEYIKEMNAFIAALPGK